MFWTSELCVCVCVCVFCVHTHHTINTYFLPSSKFSTMFLLLKCKVFMVVLWLLSFGMWCHVVLQIDSLVYWTMHHHIPQDFNLNIPARLQIVQLSKLSYNAALCTESWMIFSLCSLIKYCEALVLTGLNWKKQLLHFTPHK